MTGDDITLIGRHEVLRELLRCILGGMHALLVGPQGAGKSRLLGEALAVLQGRRLRLGCPLPARDMRILWISRTNPLGDCLKSLARALSVSGGLIVDGRTIGTWDEARQLCTGNIRLQEAILATFLQSERRSVVMFDALDRLTPAHQALLEGILASAVVAGAASQTNDSPHLERLWQSFVRIPVDNLPKAEGRLLVKHFVRAFRIAPRDPELFAQEVWQASLGNPFLTRTLVLRAGHRGAAGNGREFRREPAGRYLNMGPIYMFLASGFTLYKVFSRGLDNRESYLWFSAMGVLAFMAFRVFRQFFIFRARPGRE